MEVRPGLHRIEAPLGERFVALHLIVGARACLLVDTGISAAIGECLVPYLDGVGIPPDTIRYAVNTHCDFDHIGGNAALKRIAPAVELMCHELDRRLVENLDLVIDERYGEFRGPDGFDDPPASTAWIREVAHVTPVDRTVVGGERIDLGDRTVEIVHGPGHSPGHVAVHDLETGALCIGDAVLSDSVLTAAGRPAFPPTYRDVDPYLDTIERMLALAPDSLLPAHFPVCTGAEVATFLEVSRAYAGRVDDEVVDSLRGAAGPVATLDLVRTVAPVLGSWPAAAVEYLVFPVVGHLDRLRDQGRVEVGCIAGRRTWCWAEGR